MAGLCEGYNEPAGSLKAICNLVQTVQVSVMDSKVAALMAALHAHLLAPVLAMVMVVVHTELALFTVQFGKSSAVSSVANTHGQKETKPLQTITKNSKEPTLEIQQASHPRSHQSSLLPASEHAGYPSAQPPWNPSQKHAPSEPSLKHQERRFLCFRHSVSAVSLLRHWIAALRAHVSPAAFPPHASPEAGSARFRGEIEPQPHEDDPQPVLNRIPLNKTSVRSGDHVIVNYEGGFFPRVVLKCRSEGAQIPPYCTVAV
ncbi:hypothetical protein ANN_19018, partial [Periplaneta americana]